MKQAIHLCISHRLFEHVDLCHLDYLGSTLRPPYDVDSIFSDSQMLCQQSDNCFVGFALYWSFLDPDCEAMTILLYLLTSGVRLHPDLDSHTEVV